MKIAVECKSPLLQKSLEIFLSKYLTTYKHCDIVIRDEECLADEKCFYISCDKEKAHLVKPFSKSQLILALKNRYSDIDNSQEDMPKSSKMDFALLQKRIEYLTAQYQQDILKTIRAFYEE